MIYNYHRDYDPLVGRYVESDPVGLRAGLNTYGYVGENPIIGIDPFGRFPISGIPIVIHGYWCGPNWTGGYAKEWNQLTPSQQANALPPVDPVDAACMKHDKCYGNCRDKYPCRPDGRANCFNDCDFALSGAVYGQGAEGWAIATYMDRRNKNHPGPNAPNCPGCSSK